MSVQVQNCSVSDVQLGQDLLLLHLRQLGIVLSIVHYEHRTTGWWHTYRL